MTQSWVGSSKQRRASSSLPQQLINPRIDVFAQRALHRLSKNPATMADAARMLDAVQSGALGEICKGLRISPFFRRGQFCCALYLGGPSLLSFCCTFYFP